MTTALVTGASSGLGVSFAKQLAAAGHDLVLVARTKSALEELATELKPTNCEVLPADLADRTQVAAVAERVRQGVDVLVNNAGFGFYGPVTGHRPEQELGMVDVDVAAVVALSHAAAQAMAARGTGSILNVASTAAFAGTPGSATYSAAKSFVLLFTEALHDEMKDAGIKVSVLCPGFTRTNFQANAGLEAKGLPGFAWAEADDVVRAGLDALARNQAVCVPGIVNKVTAAAPRFATRGLTRRIARQVMKRL